MGKTKPRSLQTTEDCGGNTRLSIEEINMNIVDDVPTSIWYQANTTLAINSKKVLRKKKLQVSFLQRTLWTYTIRSFFSMVKHISKSI